MSTNADTESKASVRRAVANSPQQGDPLSKEIAASIAAAITGLEFGSVEITIHNSRVVQIERHERIRFQSPADAKKGN